MLRTFLSVPALLAVLAITGLSQETKLKPAEIPSAVAASAARQFPGAAFSHWTKETEDGKTTYEASVADAHGKRDAVFSEDGSFYSTEEAIAVSGVPAAVTSAVQAKYPKAVMQKAEKITLSSNVVQYELDLSKAAKKEVLVSAEGKILKEE